MNLIMKRILFTCLLFAFIFGFGGIQAQQMLSLEKAIEKTLQNNYGIRLAEMNVEIARNNNDWGVAGRYPRVDLNLNVSGFKSGNPGSFVPQRLNGGLSPNISWTVFDGFRVIANKARLEQLEELSVGNAALVVENNLQAVVLAFYQALLAREQVKVLEEVLDGSRERLDYESYKKDLGSTGTFEILQFRNAVITDSSNLILQRMALVNAKRNLNLLMGEEVTIPYTLSGNVNENFSDFAWQDLLDKMKSSNQNLQNQYINNHILREEVRIAKAGLFPTVSLSAGTTYSLGILQLRNRDPETAEAQPFVSTNVSAFDYSAGLSISFNLFNGGITRRQIETARINERIGDLQTEELELALTNDLLIVFDNYQIRRQLLALQTENVSNARTNLDMAGERFQSGLINSLDFRTIQLQYLSAQLSRFQALRDLKDSETELIRLTGGLVKE